MIKNNVTTIIDSSHISLSNQFLFNHPLKKFSSTNFFDQIPSSTRSTNQKIDYLINELNLNNMLALLNDSFISTTNSNLSVINLKNTSADQPEEDSYSLELWQKIFWSSVFSLMVIIAFLGNTGVICIVLLNKQMRTVTNMFIVNLSIADLLVSSGNVIFNFVYMLTGHWPFGFLYCKISNFIAILSVACSCFTLMAISVDRFIAIVYPLKPRMSLMTALNITIGIWTASSLLSLPNFIFSTTEKQQIKEEIRIMCLIRYPDGVAPESLFDYYYNLAVLISTYFLPITLMTLSYFKVATVLWGSKTIGECSSKQAQSIKSKRKIVKMMVLVLISFAICWLPYHVYFILQHHLPEITKNKHAQHIFLTLYWLAMSTSMLNPPIYCWLNSRFRRGFKKVLFCEYCKANSNERTDKRKNHLRAQMGYLNKHWPSSSEPQSTSESTVHKFKCSSSNSSQWYGSSNSGGGGQIRELELKFGQVLNVYPNNHYSTRLCTSASQSQNQSSLINVEQSETTSLKNSDQLMILNDHKSPIKVCISSEISNNCELNNNTILNIRELNTEQANDKSDSKLNSKFDNKSDCKSNDNQRHHINGKNEQIAKENCSKQYKNQQIKQKKFAIAAKQLNKPVSTSQSYSSVCLKTNFDAIEMSIEPSSSCSSIYSRKSQVDQV